MEHTYLALQIFIMRHMNVNRDKTDEWKADVARSVDLYNDWFLKFAPKAFRATRTKTAGAVTEALNATNNLLSVSSDSLAKTLGCFRR